MKFSGLSNSLYFIPLDTYETSGVCSYKVNPDLGGAYSIMMDEGEVRTISHPKGAETITIWREGAGSVVVPVDGEFKLDVLVTRKVGTI